MIALRCEVCVNETLWVTHAVGSLIIARMGDDDAALEVEAELFVPVPLSGVLELFDVESEPDVLDNE